MTSQCDQMDMDPSASQESGGEPQRKRTRLDNDYLNYSKWDADTVADKLRQKGLNETAERFREEGIIGDTLIQLEDKDFGKLGVTVTEAFVKANDHMKFVGEKGIEKKMSEAIHDMKAFSQMTDHVFNLILNSTDPNLKESRDILTNVLKRKLYKCVGQTQAKGEHMKKEEDKHVMIKEMRKLMDDDEYEISPLYDMSDHGIVLLFVDLDHGMNEKNPIENTMFYCKEKPNEAFHIRREQESNFLPSLFKEQTIRVYSKAVDQRSQNIVRQAFVRWCEENKYPTPKGGYVSSGGLTQFKAGKRPTDQVKEADQQHTRSRNNTANIKQEPDMEWNSAASCY